jgi:hypothetical protein
MDDKLPQCMGYIDGSHIILNEAPEDDPESYYTRKQRYAIQIQAVCDNEYNIMNIFVRFPGSVHDARVYVNSEIGRFPENYLSRGQYLAGDSAYPNSQYMVTPFRDNASLGTIQQRKKFNKYFSGYRVAIECTFGILKQVFSSLKGMRIRVNSAKNHKLACDWITTCCILYNIIRYSITQDEFASILEDEQEDDDRTHEEIGENRRNSIFQFFIDNKM